MTTCDRNPLARFVGFSGLAALACGLAVVAAPGAAYAQAEDQATARALFDDGRRLMKAGDYASACPKFEAAAKTYPSAGILLNLGDCYEKLGKTASAWTEFGEAASLATRTQRPSDAAEAKKRQAALEPNLTRLTIHVAHPAPGLAVTRDGEAIPQGAWGVAIPVDPGSHELRAEADGFQPWSSAANASGKGQAVTVEVPDLQPVPAPPPKPVATTEATTTPATTTAAPEAAKPSHAGALALIIAGAAVGIGGGVVMGVESGASSTASKNDDVGSYNSDKTIWTVGLVGAIAGSVAAAGGVIWLVTSRGHASSPTTGWRAAPWVGSGSAGMNLAGSF